MTVKLQVKVGQSASILLHTNVDDTKRQCVSSLGCLAYTEIASLWKHFETSPHRQTELMVGNKTTTVTRISIILIYYLPHAAACFFYVGIINKRTEVC